MYSLLISPLVEDKLNPAIEISKSRFLEYTGDAISNQLESLSVEAVDCMEIMALHFDAGGEAKKWRMSQITSTQIDSDDIRIIVRPIVSCNA